MKTKHFILLLIFTSVVVFAILSFGKKVTPSKPNIVFILADDLGYGDITSLNKNSKIPTPNIDEIANSGVIFTDAHSSSAVCTPTRYGILTGRYNWRSKQKRGVLGGYSKALISDDRTTMAHMLKKQGYTTAAIGKWHLGWDWNNIEKGNDSVDYSKPIFNGPTARGFDYFYGFNGSLDMPPYVYVENDMPTSIPNHETVGNNKNPSQEGYNGALWRKGPTGSDFNHQECLPNLTSRIVKYIEEKAPGKQPYFAYYPMPAPHTPILPSKEFEGKSGLNSYADFVMMVDHEVGKIVEAIRRTGEEDNTIIVLTSDNGCSPLADFNTLLSKGHNPSFVFRGHKADLFEGGHRIPCIVKWPAVIKEKHEVSQTICLTDFMATFAKIAGYRLADNEAEDSYNLLPVLTNPGNKKIIREATVGHSINGSFTILKDDWKLLLAPGSGGWSFPRPGKDTMGLPPIQLYNLKSDIDEKNNVYKEHPKVVKELKSLLKKYIVEGRSTPGRPQKNDGKYPWPQIQDIIN
ncbi:arylsulfatase [Gaetbulibacter sp. M240]|uniref:sulfatase family protein n=1 Tax=Gaetbulibacter sp. M240 TaxID=3126511 RepID=UPI00374F7B69